MADEVENTQTSGEEGHDDDGSRQEDAAPSFFSGPDSFDRSIPDVYANTTHVTLGASDISILFGYLVEGQSFKPSVRVTLTHHSFMTMMQPLIQRLILLRRMYRNQSLSLYDLAEQDPNEWEQALEEAFGNE